MYGDNSGYSYLLLLKYILFEQISPIKKSVIDNYAFDVL